MREWFFSLTPIALMLYFIFYPTHFNSLLLNIRYYMY
jgi:hypothetical protein